MFSTNLPKIKILGNPQDCGIIFYLDYFYKNVKRDLIIKRVKALKSQDEN